MYPQIKIGELHLPTYGVIVIIALIAMVVLSLIVLHNARLPLFDGIVLGAYGLLGAFLGAKFLFLLQKSVVLSFTTESDWLYFFSSGGSAYGGILLGLIFSRIGAYIHKIELTPYMEEIIFLLPLCHGIWKIGCCCAGCCYGIPYDGPGSIFIVNEFYTEGAWLFPIQIVEVIALFIISFLLFRSNRRTVCLYLCSYSVCRFFIEFLKNDEIKTYIGIMSDIQYLCLIVISIFVGMKLIRRLSNEKAI